MDKTKIKSFQTTLENMAREISRQANEQDRRAIVVETSAEQCEQDVLAAQRDMAVQSLSRRTRLLRDVNAALARIREGSYGECLECDGPIGERRLRAVPQARHCIACQERMEGSSQCSFRVQWAA